MIQEEEGRVANLQGELPESVPEQGQGEEACVWEHNIS